jgi:predicted DNA-binding transcriptional regulator AlpA
VFPFLAAEEHCMKRIYKLHPDFIMRIARYGIGMNQMAELSGISRATLYALQHPGTHPHRTRGGMHPTTLWKIANAFSAHTGMEPEAAKDLLFVEEVVQSGTTTGTEDTGTEAL